MYSGVITGGVLWIASGFICAVCAYALADSELRVRDIVLTSVGLSTAGPLLLFILIAVAVSVLSESPAVWGEE